MARSLIDESYDPIYDQVRGILGEHFENYCFIVMDGQGELFYDYNHLPAGRMLLREMQLEIGDDNIEIEWEFESDPDELDDDAVD
jgi:sulfur relay (sulfurtransferase) DsrC/TusE family protein